ncbi:hypothetical protein [Clostridium perfringens]|uniref:hypothetical protein n=1 Tax=Clostridium perfringens TaxID=1502 RepID=UPI0032DB1581
MKKIIISTILSSLFIISLGGNVVLADNLTNYNDILAQENQSQYNFEDTPYEIIDKMKNDLNSDKIKNGLNENSRALSSLMASALDSVGFNHSANLLNYSMLALREDPYRFQSTSSISNEIWTYSTDFRTVVTNFLNEARANKSYEYFKSTTMAFKMPNASKAQILSNTGLKKRTDFFGALHNVTIHLGIVKQGVQWDMLVMIEDTYDFKQEQYNGLVNIVNNIAYYDQERGKIKPYKVLITANKPRLIAPPFNVPIW